MSSPLDARLRALAHRARASWADRQARNSSYLMLNSVVGAAAGLAFWLVVVRVYSLPDAEVGVGVAVISLCTAIALLAKGGLDTALVRHGARASRADGLRMLRLATLLSLAGVAVLAGALALLPAAGQGEPLGLGAAELGLVAALSFALAVTWLQDAHFLAAGEARLSFYRNLALHSGRLAAPAVVVALALPYAIPAAWGLALVLSALVAALLIRRLPGPATRAEPVAPRAFLRSAGRNVTGSAAEFLPGLMLPPLVLHLRGPQEAAWFGIAWTGASVLFLLSAAIGRSAFAEMARSGAEALHLRRAARHHLATVLPAMVAALLLAPWIMGLFGPGYAQHSAGVFALLAATAVLVAPVYLYLALLRAREARRVLVLYPAVLVVALFVLAPALGARFGLEGVALAWAAVHAPLAAWAVLHLRRAMAQEVSAPVPDPSAAVGGAPHVE